MTKLIAVAGKGGTGKTTTAAMTVRYLIEQGKTPVFAVDADPNYTLGEALGIPVEQTIGMLREKFIGERAEIPPGMSKDAVLERQLHAAIHEAEGVDLLVMGRQEGPGCYCALNNVLRNFLEMVSSDYPYVVVDNEAGMEHLSRRNTRKIDVLLIVAEHSVKAARAAGRISQLAEELGLSIGKSYIVLNKVPGEPSPEVREEIKSTGVELLVTLPEDEKLAEADAKGTPIAKLPATPAYERLSGALSGILK
ncbi:MAG: carbon monoxide dehydrogenase [Deltaproteobacteria bacterium]|nr:MAG: carbon monoxide dehydrogenase [Deltaproteobacteria bacterium]